MQKGDLVFIHHIRDACLRILEYIKGFSQVKFSSSNLVQSAVIRQLEIIGEATKNLSKEFRTNTRKFPGRSWLV